VLYTDYLLTFELASVVLLVAIVAAIALTLREKRESKSMDPSEQVLVKKADRIRIIKMDAVKEELPAEPQPINPKFKEHK
jgi:NADH-quinone oxidoreductase subunit J